MRVTIGRDSSCTISLPDSCQYASRNHGAIIYENGILKFEDHSTNGTSINGEMIKNDTRVINRGDQIKISGRYLLDWNQILQFIPLDPRSTIVGVPGRGTVMEESASGSQSSSVSNPAFEQKAESVPPKPDNHLVLAILCTVFCCLPLGIVGIVYANKVDSLYAMKQYQEAKSASDSASQWSWIGIIISGVISVLYFFGMLGALAG